MFNFRKNKKGFTLVELIVVLVILAILAAIMIPNMTGWIDRAKDRSAIVGARTVVLAAQTVVSEGYGDAANAPTLAKVTTLADLGSSITTAPVVYYDGGKVTYVSCGINSKMVYYTPADGYSTTALTVPSSGTLLA